jgi:enamine deaminase RidA (YjgF/YER057c/UK114 family)
VSYHDLAQGIEVCDDCIADKLPAVVTPPKLETTDIGDAIRSALHPEQTVYATTPDLSLLEQQVDRTNRVAEMCQVVETVLGAQPTKYFRTEQIMMQARGRVAGASRSEISYALRKLKMNGKIVNKRHGVWQWACITEMAFQFAEPKPPIDFTLAPSAPDVTYTEAPPMSVTPITSGQLNTAPLLAKPEPVADQADQELKDLDEALEAIVKLEKVVRKYRGLAKQLAALKAALNAVGEEP